MTSYVRVTQLLTYKTGREAHPTRWEVWTEQDSPAWPKTLVFDLWDHWQASLFQRALDRGHRLTVEWHDGPQWRHVDKLTWEDADVDPANGRIVCHACNVYLKQHPLERDQ